MTDIQFDDIAALRGRISEDYGAWGPTITVTQDMIQRFADLTGDQQWIHVDVERAKKGPFGVAVAHGLFTVALVPMMKAALDFNIVGCSSRINYGAENFRFIAPVPSGSQIHARMRLADVREHKAGTLLVQEIQVQVVDATRPSLIYLGLGLLRR